MFFFIALSSLVLVLLLVSAVMQQKPQGFPPGPRGLPFLGYYPWLNTMPHYDMSAKLASEYGPIIGMNLGFYKAVFVNGWEAVKEALMNEDLVGRPDVCLVRDVFGGKSLGIVFTDGDFWKAQRRFALQHFRNLGFAKRSHALVIQEEAQELAKDFSKIKGSFAVDVPIALAQINIIWGLLNGKRLPRNDPRLYKVRDYIAQIMRDITVTGNLAIALPFLRYIFPGWTGTKSIRAAGKGFREFIQTAVDEHKKNPDYLNGEPKDFIGIYLKELEENKNLHESFTEEQLVALCLDIITATSDTSTSVMCFTIMFLCLYPQIQEKVHEELDRVVGIERLPTLDDKNNLPYLEAVLMEEMRMRAPGPVVIHTAVKDTTVQGYTLPNGGAAFINLRSVLMDPEYWGDPEVYRPERFITEEGKLKREERLIQFSKGKRSCLGESLAKMTSYLIMATLLQKFKFSFSSGGAPKNIKGRLGFALHAPDFKVVVTPRF